MILHKLTAGLLLSGAMSVHAFEFFPPRYLMEASYSEGRAPFHRWQHVYAFQDGAGNDLIADLVSNIDDKAGEPQSRVLVYDTRLGTIDQINRHHPVNSIAGRDIDSDGHPELVLLQYGEDFTHIEIIAWPLDSIICEFKLDSRDYPNRKDNIWGMDITVGPLIPRVLSGRPALLLGIKNGYGLTPRELALIDPLNGRDIWHCRVPNGIETMELMDVDGDSIPEIFAGGNASDNGAEYDSLSDNHSYLFSVDAVTGRLRWITEFSGPFSTALGYPLHRDDSNVPALFVAFSANHPDAGRNRILRVNAIDGETLSSLIIPDTTLGCEAHRWGHDEEGMETFVVAVKNRGLMVYNSALQLITQSSQVDGILLVSDLDGDGESEVLGRKGGMGTIMLDHDLSMIASAEFSFTGPPVKQKSWQSDFAYIWGETRDGVTRISLIGNPEYFYRLLFYSGLVLGSIIILFLLHALYITRLRVVKLRAQSEHERYQAWAAMATKLAHDIRTPLSVLRLSAQNLEQELDVRFSGVPEQIRHYFRTFREEAERLSNVSRTFLTFSRVTPPRLEPTDLAALVRKSVERRPHPENVAVDLNLQSGLPPANVDPPQIVTLIDNLLSNSYRAMSDGGTLTVKLQTEQKLRDGSRRKEWLLMQFSDTGQGIAEKDLPKIFEPYFTRSEDGTGIGLVLVKKIVEDHMGTISVKSILGEGTTFSVRFPIGDRSNSAARNE